MARVRKYFIRVHRYFELLVQVHQYRTCDCLPPPSPGVMQLLRPLLLDVVPTIQQTAALALGRLANYNDDLAEAVVKGDILPQLVYSLAEQNVSTLPQGGASLIPRLQPSYLLFWGLLSGGLCI